MIVATIVKIVERSKKDRSKRWGKATSFLSDRIMLNILREPELYSSYDQLKIYWKKLKKDL